MLATRRGSSAAIRASCIVAEAAQAVHDPAQAIGAVAVLEVAAFAVHGAQSVARPLQARLVAVQVGVVLAEMHADLGEGGRVLVQVGAQVAQGGVEAGVVVLVVSVVLGGEGRGEVVDVLGAGALEGVAEGLRDVRRRCLGRVRRCLQAGSVSPEALRVK